MALGQGYVAALDNFINSLIVEPIAEKAGGFLSRLGSGFVAVTGAAVAATSSITEGIVNVAGSMSLSRSPEIEAPQEKVGMNAQPERVAARDAMLNDPSYAFNNDVRVPTTKFDKILQLEGIQV